jgi:hypothetical protein
MAAKPRIRAPSEAGGSIHSSVTSYNAKYIRTPREKYWQMGRIRPMNAALRFEPGGFSAFLSIFVLPSCAELSLYGGMTEQVCA